MGGKLWILEMIQKLIIPKPLIKGVEPLGGGNEAMGSEGLDERISLWADIKL